MGIFTYVILYLLIQSSSLYSEIPLDYDQEPFLLKQSNNSNDDNIQAQLLEHLPQKIQHNRHKEAFSERLRMAPIIEPLQKHFIIPLFFQTHEPKKKKMNPVKSQQESNSDARTENKKQKKTLRISPTKEFNIMTDG